MNVLEKEELDFLFDICCYIYTYMWSRECLVAKSQKYLNHTVSEDRTVLDKSDCNVLALYICCQSKALMPHEWSAPGPVSCLWKSLCKILARCTLVTE